MISPAATHSEHGLVVVRHDGTILLEHGLRRWIAPSDESDPEGVHLATVLRAEDGGDLSEVVAQTASGGRKAPSLLVTSVGGPEATLLHLTLYRLDDERLIGVLSDVAAKTVSSRTPVATPLLHAWAALRDAMALASVGDEEEGPVILAANDAFCTLFGLWQEEAEGRELVPFLAPDDGSSLRASIRTSVVGEGEPITDLSVLQGALRQLRLVEWEIAPIRNAEGRVQSLIAIVGDARSSTLSRPIHRGPDIDPLPGIPNLAHLMSRIERSLERAGQTRSHGFAVIGLLTENLRDVERQLGTALSNAVLEALVWRVKRCLRPGDLVAGIGRDRLALLLDYFAPHGDVDHVLERIREATEAPYTIAGEKVSMPVIGVAGPVYGGDDALGGARAILDDLEHLTSRPRNPIQGE